MWNSIGIHEQLKDLGYARRELIYATQKTTPNLGLGMLNLNFSEQRLSNSGLLLYQLMWLDRISSRDHVEVIRALSEKE